LIRSYLQTVAGGDEPERGIADREGEVFPCRVARVFRRRCAQAPTRRAGCRRKVERLAEFDVVASEVADMLAAIDLQRLHEMSFWDAPIMRSAKPSGCKILLSNECNP
jgi:predicted nucleic acid-binding protein